MSQDADEIAPCFDDGFRAGLAALFRWRRDVRRFRPDPIPEATVARLLGLAGLAPSVGLSEPWRFVLVESPDRRAAIRDCFEACNREAGSAYGETRRAAYSRLKLAGLDEAPVHIAAFCEPDPIQGHGLGRATMPEMAAYSAAMAIHTIWLAARAEGLGLGWVSILDPARVALILDVPASWSLVGYLCVGYPEDERPDPELQRAGWERRGDTVVLRR